MTSKTGSSTNIILKSGSTFGTAAQGTTGDRVIVESLSHSENTEEITFTGIGSGLDMTDDSIPGAKSPTVQIEKVARYDDAANMAEAVFFGFAGKSSVGGGYYDHSFIYNATRGVSFITTAFDASVGSVMEYESGTPTRISLNASNAPGPLNQTIEMLANEVVRASTVNTTASLAAATVANSLKVIVKPEDVFAINAQAGSAINTSTDFKAITSISIELAHEAEHAREIKNSSGNGIPISSGNPPFSATVTVTFRELVDFQWFNAHRDEIEYKALFQASNGSYQKALYFPRLKVVQDPEFNLTTPSTNPLTVTFKALAAASIPSGMFSLLPHERIRNTRATPYI